jgi:hypothetical protein
MLMIVKKEDFVILLKSAIKKYVLNFYFKNYRFKKVKVLGRRACLGQEVLGLLKHDIGEYNFQKHRIDFILSERKRKKLKFKNVLELLNIVKTTSIKSIILSQDVFFFDAKRPDFILMDSFSELADQIFQDRRDEQIKFVSVYSDINHEHPLSKNYISDGLLKVEQLKNDYLRFFQQTLEHYPNVPIFFLHFSTALDNRAKFKQRASEIYKVLQQCSQVYPNIYNIKIDDNIVLDLCHNKKDQFPYHYTKEVYKVYLERILATDGWRHIKNV